MKAEENRLEKIPGMSGKLPFEVPANYFDELPLRIQERMAETPKTPVLRIYDMVRPRLALAAMIIGLIAVGYAGLRMVLGNRETRLLTADEITTAIEYFGYEFDDEMLIAAVVESDIDLDPQYADNEIDEIIEYLSGEDIEFGELLNDY
ncbi:MAG: hypothetical protein KAT31_02095 [Bacteroidales bacterium]|nr:hypothetical protein [Bacteroidales bacterium]